MYCLNRGKSRALWGEGRMGECDKVFEDERNDGSRRKKRERGGGLWSVRRRGTAAAVVVKVTSLPCEVEWYLNLTFAGTMSIHCHSCACVGGSGACLFRRARRHGPQRSLIVCNNESFRIHCAHTNRHTPLGWGQSRFSTCLYIHDTKLCEAVVYSLV